MAFGAIGIGTALTLGKLCPPGDSNRSAEIGGIRGAALLGNHHFAPGGQATSGPAHILHMAGESIGEQATGGFGGADGGPGAAFTQKRDDGLFDSPMNPRPGAATAARTAVSEALPIPGAHPARLDAASAVGADFFDTS